jgi:predicted PilT family ATPase
MANVEEMLSTRLEKARLERSARKDELDMVDAKLRSLISRAGPKQRESLDDIARTEAKLEKKHRSEPQTSATERAFMREMDKLSQARKSIVTRLKQQEEIDGLKDQRTAISQSLREIENAINELAKGYKKMTIASKAGCSGADVLDEEIPVPETSFAYIIGKGGSSLNALETTHGVSIKLDKAQSKLLVMGSAAGIAGLREAVQVIVDTVHIEYTIPEQVVLMLLMKKACLAQEMQKQLSVRLDVSRVNSLVKISGLSEKVLVAKSAIQRLESTSKSVRIPIKASFVPVLIGKGGSAISQLESQFDVQITAKKDAGDLVVTGMCENVDCAVTHLVALSQENAEAEIEVEISKVLVGLSYGGKAPIDVRAIQGDFDCLIRVEREPAPAPASMEKDEANIASGSASASASANSNRMIVRMKGRACVVRAAESHLRQRVEVARKNVMTIAASGSALAAVLGKGGGVIKGLRENNPDAVIEVDHAGVNVWCSESEARAAVEAEISKIVRENGSVDVPCGKANLLLLKTASAGAFREQLSSLGVSMSLKDSATNPETGLVRLRSAPEALAEAESLLRDFLAQNETDDVPCAEEDFIALMDGGETSELKKLHSKYQVNSFYLRKVQVLRLRGHSAALAAARAHMLDFLSGSDMNGCSRVVSIPELALSVFIGKGGSNLNRLQMELGVKVDLLRSESPFRVRVRAASPEEATRAAEDLAQFIDGIRCNEMVLMSPILSANRRAELATRAARFYGVEVEEGMGEKDRGKDKAKAKNKEKDKDNEKDKEKDNEKGVSHAHAQESVLSLRGVAHAVSLAKAFLVERQKEAGYMRIPLATVLCDGLSSRWAQLTSALSGVPSLRLDRESQAIELTGSWDSIEKSYMHIYSQVEHFFPAGSFVSVPMDHMCLMTLVREGRFDGIQGDRALVSLVPDQLFSCVRVMGNAQEVSVAVDQLREWRELWLRGHIQLDIEPFMISHIIGGRMEAGFSYLKKQAETGVAVTVNKKALRLVIDGTDEQKVKEVVAEAQTFLAKLRADYLVLRGDEAFARQVVGKGGTRIKSLRAEFGASIEVDNRTHEIEIQRTGPEAEKMFEMLQGMLADHTKKVRQQQAVQAALESPRSPESLSVSSHSDDNAAGADMNMSTDPVLSSGGQSGQTSSALLELGLGETSSSVPHPPPPVNRAPVGASAEMLSASRFSNLSASAQRRLRRKHAVAAAAVASEGVSVSCVSSPAPSAPLSHHRLPVPPSSSSSSPPSGHASPLSPQGTSTKPSAISAGAIKNGSGGISPVLTQSLTKCTAAPAARGAATATTPVAAPAPAPLPSAVSNPVRFASTSPSRSTSTISPMKSPAEVFKQISADGKSSRPNSQENLLSFLLAGSSSPSGGASGASVNRSGSSRTGASRVENVAPPVEYFVSKSGLKIRL